MTLELHATPKEVMRAVESLQEFGQAQEVSENALFGLALALEECASNIVNHALGRDPTRTFQVTLAHTPAAMVIELRDDGPPFDPTLAAVTETYADSDPGGWGIFLVRRYMDEIHYSRQDGENVLRLTKNLADPPSNR